MWATFGPETAMIVRPYGGGPYTVMPIETLFLCWDQYCVWSPSGWTRITGMIKQPQQSAGLPVVVGSVDTSFDYSIPTVTVPSFEFPWRDYIDVSDLQSTCIIQNLEITCDKTDENWVWEINQLGNVYDRNLDKSTRHNIKFDDLQSAKKHAEKRAIPHLKVRVQWMQSKENLVVGHASLIKVLSDPARLPNLRETLFSYLIEPLIRMVWDYVSYSWLIDAKPSEWYRCPLPPASETSKIPNDEPLLLVCDRCFDCHGFKPDKVVIETDFYFHDPITGRQLCQDDVVGEPDKSGLILRRNHRVTQTDLINHPNPRRYIDEWEKQARREEENPEKWFGSCWANHDVQTDVLIVNHAGFSHSISHGPHTAPIHLYHKSNQKSATNDKSSHDSKANLVSTEALNQNGKSDTDGNGHDHIDGDLDVLKRFDRANGNPLPEREFHPDYCYGIQTENKTFCAGIGFWAFTN